MQVDKFSEILQDLGSYKKKLTTTAYRYAKETIIALQILQSHTLELCKIKNEDMRNQKITDLTGLIAEPGLVKGSQEDEIANNLALLIQILFSAFEIDKKNNDTLSLYKDGFMGPPCFNGRMITLTEYVQVKQKFMDPLLLSDKKSYDQLAYEYSELMYRCREDSSLPNLQEFIIYLSNPNIQNYRRHQEIIHGVNPTFEEIYKRACELFVS